MTKPKIPSTPAVRALRSASVDFVPFVYDYKRHPGAEGAAEFIGVNPYETAKTVVFATSEGGGVLVIMHGDREVSTKSLSRLLGVKSCRPATVEEGQRWTGYQFGGTSPLGTRTKLPVLMESTLLALEIIYINAGSRGLVVGVDPAVIADMTGAVAVEVATSAPGGIT